MGKIKFLTHFDFLVLAGLFNIIFKIYTHKTGCMSPDSYSYIWIAYNLPKYENSVFPFGYPLLIRIIYFFVENYFLATKLISVFSYVGIYIFCRISNFFWKEISLILCFSGILSIFPFSWSEPLFIFIFVIWLYYFNIFLNTLYEGQKLMLYFKLYILIMLLSLIKYSSIFLVISVGIFSFIKLYNNGFKKDLLKKLFLINSINCLSLFILITINYLLTKDFFGEGVRKEFEQSEFSIVSFFVGILMIGNPFIQVLPKVHWLLQMLILAIGLIGILGGTYLIYSKLRNKKNNFDVFLIITGLVFLFLTIFSFFKFKIDDLNFRLLVISSFCFYLLVLKGIIYMRFKKLFISIAIISLLMIFATNLYTKSPNLKNILIDNNNIHTLIIKQNIF